MPLLDSVKPDDALSVDEVAKIIGFERDTVIRQIHAGNLPAMVLPRTAKSRKRVFRSYRVFGRDLIEFVLAHMKRKPER